MTADQSNPTDTIDYRRPVSPPAPAGQDIGQVLLAELEHELGRSVERIRHCVDQLSDEQVWWRPTEPQNSIGNLLLHLCGNVRQWIISGVGGEPDVRRRAEEFSERGPIPKAELLRQLDETVHGAATVLRVTGPGRLLEPLRIQGFDTSALAAVIHSVAHFAGHVQEIVCLTRMQLGDDYRYAWTPTSPEQGRPEHGRPAE